MNYSNKELADYLSLRYVTGILRGPARNRFKRLVTQNKILADSLKHWEDLLSPLAWSLEPVRPSELVWPRIQREIKANAQQQTPKQTLAKTSPHSNWFFSAAAAALAVVTSIGWWNSTQQAPETIIERVVETVIETVPEAADIAVINSADGKAIWVARIYDESARLDIDVKNVPESQTDKDYQLWALTGDGTPVSLGLLPKNDKFSVKLDPAKLEALRTTSTLAVSLEPLGGSPKTVPTGPVLYTAALM